MKFRGFRIVGLAVSVAGCIVQKPPASHAAVAGGPLYPQRVLQMADGLRVVLEQTPDLGSAEVSIAVAAGSADDPPDKPGLAHFAEHVVFNSSHGGSSLEAQARVLGSVNALTSRDQTIYFALTDVGTLPQTVAMVRGSVAEPLAGIDGSVIERERRTVENEVRWRHVEETVASDELTAAVFSPQHPYAHPVGGTVSSVAHFSLADVQAFTGAHYRLAASTLVVLAPLSLDEQQKVVERVTGQADRVLAVASRAPETETAAAPPPGLIHSYTTAVSPVADPTLSIGWALPNGPAASDMTALIAATVPGLAFALHEHDPDISTARAETLNASASDMLVVNVVLKEGAHPERSARLVIDELQSGLGKRASGFGGFDAMTRFFGTEYVYGQERLWRRALDTAWAYQHTGVPTFLEKRGERMTHLAAGDVLSYAQKFLSADRAHVVFLRPGTPEQPAVEPLVQAAVRSTEPAAAPVMAPAPTSSELGVGPAAPPHALLTGLETHVLSNGLTVVLLRRPGSPFHAVSLGFRGGRAAATPTGVISAAEWARLWNSASPRFWGVSHHDWSDASGTIEMLRGQGTDVAGTLSYLRQQLGYSVFWPPKNFTDRISVFERESARPAEVLQRQMVHALFGDRPLGKPATAHEIQQVTPLDLNHWLSRVRQPKNGVLVVVGDFSPREVLAAAETELGSWGAGGAAAPPPATPAPQTEIDGGARTDVFFTHRAGATQATLRFACVLPETTSGTWASRLMFGRGLQGSLHNSLREGLGASYHVAADVEVVSGTTSVLWLSTDVDYALLPQAITRLREALARPELTFGAGSAFYSLRSAAMRGWQAGMETTADWADNLRAMWTLGWPLDLRDRLVTDAAATGPEDLAALADHCRNNSVVGLLGDEPRLRRSWEEAAR